VLYSSLNITQVIKTNRMVWAGHVAHMGDNNSHLKNNALSQQLPQIFRESRKKHQDYQITKDLDYPPCILYTHFYASDTKICDIIAKYYLQCLNFKYLE
jgi:hypothetical protein